MVKKRPAAQSRTEHDIFDRVLLWFGLSLVLEMFLLAVNRFYFNYRVSEIAFVSILHKAVLPALTYAGLVGMVACILWAVLRRKRGDLLLPLSLAVCSVLLSLGCFFARTYGPTGLQVLQVLIPVLVVLLLLYHLYQKEFFVITLLSGLCIFGLWLYRRGGTAYTTLSQGYFAAFGLVLIAAAALMIWLQRNEGVLMLGDREYRVFRRDACYVMIYITCALAALAVGATLLLGQAAAYYTIFVLVGWLFVMAVYFTVRLM